MSSSGSRKLLAPPGKSCVRVAAQDHQNKRGNVEAWVVKPNLEISNMDGWNMTTIKSEVLHEVDYL